MAAAIKNAKAGGRKAGVPNKLTADIKALAGQYGPEAIKTLAHIMVNGETEPGRIAAAKELLDRAYGKARQGVDVEGNLKATITQITRRILD